MALIMLVLFVENSPRKVQFGVVPASDIRTSRFDEGNCGNIRDATLNRSASYNARWSLQVHPDRPEVLRHHSFLG